MSGTTTNYQLKYATGDDPVASYPALNRESMEKVDAALKGISKAPGPEGPPGPQGPQGPAGPTGPAGPVGYGPAAMVTVAAFDVAAWTEVSPSNWAMMENQNAPSSQVTPTGLVCKVAGLYLITCQMPWNTDPASGTTTFLKVKVNGTTRAEDIRTGTGYEQVQTLTFVMRLAVNDALRAYVVSSSAGKAGGIIQGGVGTLFAMTQIA